MPKGKQIAISVFSLHLLLLFILAIHHLASSEIKPKRPIAIRTVRPIERMPLVTQQSSQKSPSILPPKTKIGSPKKNRESIPAKKSPTPKPAVSTKPQGVKKSNSLQEISKNLDAIFEEDPILESKKSDLLIPKEIKFESKLDLFEEGPKSSFLDSSYKEALIFYLEKSLELPEIGEVKAHIEITQNGTLKSFEILHAKSQKNAEFLKKRLPELTFPCFNSVDSGNDSLVFKIVFRNVENR